MIYNHKQESKAEKLAKEKQRDALMKHMNREELTSDERAIVEALYERHWEEKLREDEEKRRDARAKQERLRKERALRDEIAIAAMQGLIASGTIQGEDSPKDYAEATAIVLNGDMYIAHPSYNPQKLTFTSATNWTIANHAPTALTLTANNRPSAVGVYEQRLVYGGSNNNPNKLWFSKSANFNDFTTGTAATRAYLYADEMLKERD